MLRGHSRETAIHALCRKVGDCHGNLCMRRARGGSRMHTDSFGWGEVAMARTHRSYRVQAAYARCAEHIICVSPPRFVRFLRWFGLHISCFERKLQTVTLAPVNCKRTKELRGGQVASCPYTEGVGAQLLGPLGAACLAVAYRYQHTRSRGVACVYGLIDSTGRNAHIFAQG